MAYRKHKALEKYVFYIHTGFVYNIKMLLVISLIKQTLTYLYLLWVDLISEIAVPFCK